MLGTGGAPARRSDSATLQKRPGPDPPLPARGRRPDPWRPPLWPYIVLALVIAIPVAYPAARGSSGPTAAEAPLPHRGPIPGPGIAPADGGPGSRPVAARAGPAGSTAPPNLTISGTTVANYTQNLTVGNLTIEDSAALIFGNQSWSATLTVVGNISVEGSASFRLWDGYLVLEESYGGERSVDAYNSSRITLDEAFVSSGAYSWDGGFYGASNLTVLGSAFRSHGVLQFENRSTFYAVRSEVAADVQPFQDASITQVDCGGSAYWFPFGAGSPGTYTFPPAGRETNYSFPVPGSTGATYRYQLVDDWFALIAVDLFDGANITLEATSGVDIAFQPVGSSLNASGLRSGTYSNRSLSMGNISLRLDNVSVDTWAFYPVDSSVRIVDSEIGEVLGWSGSTIALDDSNLTDLGGAYGVYDDSTLRISGCTIGSSVTGYDASRVELRNSTTGPGVPVVALGTSVVQTNNLTLGANSTYQAQQSGLLLVRDPLTVTASLDQRPYPGALVDASASGSLSFSASGVTGPTGQASFDPLLERVTASGAERLGRVDLTVTGGSEGAETELAPTGPSAWTAAMVPLVRAIEPANGSTGLSPATNVTLGFAFPMDRAATGSALGIVPNEPVSLDWNGNNTSVTLTPLPAWSPGSTVTVTLGPGAVSAEGLALPAAWSLTFTVATPAPGAPTVLGSDPSNGATMVPLTAAIAIEFNRPMESGPTAAAFTASPALPPGQVTVNQSLLLWTAPVPLRPSTSYQITIGPGATATDGAGLPAPWTISFETIPAALVPTLVASSPGNGTVLPEPPRALVLTFNVPMDPNATAAAFSLRPTLPGTVRISGTALAWTPLAPWRTNATYTVTVGTGARSAAGVPMPVELSISFAIAANLTGRSPGTGAAGTPLPSAEVLGGFAALTGAVGLGAFAAGRWPRKRRADRPPSRPADPGR